MRKALITGASGFIGGRLAEVLHGQGTAIATVVRTWSQAARLARLPVEMTHGDILDIDSLRRGIGGCDVVFHCAVDWRRGAKANRLSSGQGTENVMRVALETGVQRVVFLSSIGVFGGNLRQEVLTEEDPCPHTGDAYGDGKIDAEKVALGYYRKSGLPVTILRPTLVFGPYGRSFTAATVAAIREGRMVLVNGGAGICNSLYVDNLVDAMLLSAQHPRATGEVFHISDARPVTWKEFIEGHARALGDTYLPLPEMTVQEIEAARARSRSGSSIRQTLRLLRDPHIQSALRSIPLVSRFETAGRQVAKRVLPIRGQFLLRERAAAWRRQDAENTAVPPPRPLIDPSAVRLYAERTVFSIEKARGILGYAPKVSFVEGMARTAAWIKWARL